MNKKFARMFAVVAGLSMVVALGACGGSSASSSGTKADKDMTVGFVAVGPEGGYRTAQENDIKKEFKKAGITLKYSAPTSGNSNDQKSQIDAFASFVNEGVDAILLDPTEASGWEPSLESAKKAQIPVLLVDRMIEPNKTSLYTAHIGVNGVDQAAKAAEKAVSWAKERGGTVNAVELQGPAGLSIVNDRHNGWVKGIKGSNITMLGTTGANWDTATAKTQMTNLLQKYNNNIQIVNAQNDEMALGAMQAIQAAGLGTYPKDPKGVYVIGYDATKDGLDPVAAGTMALDVETPPNFGATLVKYTEKVVNGKSVPKETYLPFKVFDQSLAKSTDINVRGY